MSLRPDHQSTRSRSKSPAHRHRDRDRSRSHAREPSQYRAADAAAAAAAAAATPQYEFRQPGQAYATHPVEPITMGNYSDLPPSERPAFAHPVTTTPAYAPPPATIQYAPAAQQYSYTSQPAHGGPTRTPAENNGGYQYATTTSNITYTATPVTGSIAPPPPPAVRHTTQSSAPTYSYPQHSQPPQPQYTPLPHVPPPPMGNHSPRPERQRAASYSGNTTTMHDGRKVVEMVPGRMNAPPSPSLYPDGRQTGNGRADGLRMDRLSVSGNRPDLQTIVPGGYPGGAMPPPSPLLEAYHGTYQSISPMPHAMMLDDDLDHLSSLDGPPSRSRHRSHSRSHSHSHSHSHSQHSPSPPSRPSRHRDKLALEAYGGDGRGPEREKRRVKIYDAEDDAKALVDALAARVPDADALIEILPMLSHDQMLELRAEYKRHCKVQGRGINIAKHVKLKTTGNFGKIAYVTALGKYEGEGYWANYWYQANSAKRELLIEALMGRQNHEMREIKDAFRDKRYSDSLVRCMDKELKADKFRKAVLMALDAERQEESDVWPAEYRSRDADTLYQAMRAKEGGESTMLAIVIMRSDAHLRDVLRTYEKRYQGNFARDALRKSNNLVGEIIAHILNGVINRPARDAMLLHHALMDLIEPVSSSFSSTRQPPPPPPPPHAPTSTTSRHERQQRFELLISRLVRLHWDRLHLMRVKTEYEDKYGRMVEEDLEEATKGDFREFCIQLCQTGR